MVRLPPDSRTRIDAEAAAWLAHLTDGDRSDATKPAFRAWLNADPRHEAAFERATDIWEALPGAASAGESAAKARPRHRVLAMAMGIAATLAIGGGYAWLAMPPSYETAIGQQQTMTLDDGSRISLNTDSRITVLFTEGERRIRLDRGEAMFEVTKDRERPFVVAAGDERVIAVGTTFVVRREDEKLAVTLIEGRVAVTRPGRAERRKIAMLSAGQRVTVTENAGAALDRPPVEAVTAWRRGEVMFDETSLIDAAAELNRYGTVHVVVADPAIASLRVSGVFTTRDVGEFAQAIAALHGLRIEREANVLRLTRKPGARGDLPGTL